MEIFLYNGDESEFIKFPVIPKSININSPQEIENFKTIGQGDINLTGLLGNRTLEISSFFPFKDYKFSKDKTLKAMEYIEKIEFWRKNRKPLYITVSNLNISFRCVISKLDYGIKDGSGDVEYSLSISEFLRSQEYIKKTKEAIKTVDKTATEKAIVALNKANKPITELDKSKDVIKRFKDASVKTEDLKGKIRTGPGNGYKISEIEKEVKRIKIYSKFDKNWIKVQGGYILKQFLPKF